MNMFCGRAEATSINNRYVHEYVTALGIYEVLRGCYTP